MIPEIINCPFPKQNLPDVLSDCYEKCFVVGRNLGFKHCWQYTKANGRATATDNRQSSHH
jgi:hypothetical protein